MSDVLQALYRGDHDEAEHLASGRELDVFEAAALGRAERVRELLDDDASRANAFGDDGFHPLGLAYMVWAGVVGAGLGALFTATGSLCAPATAHAMYNLLALAYLRRRSIGADGRR